MIKLNVNFIFTPKFYGSLVSPLLKVTKFDTDLNQEVTLEQTDTVFVVGSGYSYLKWLVDSSIYNIGDMVNLSIYEVDSQNIETLYWSQDVMIEGKEPSFSLNFC